MKQIDLSQWLVACYQSFARRIGLTGLVGLLLCCCAFGEGRAPSPTYYDARERAAAALTFEWATTKTVNFSLEFIQRFNHALLNQADAIGAPLDMVRLIDESLANRLFELSALYTIERMPQKMRVRLWEQAVNLQAPDTPDAKENFVYSETYIQGAAVAHVSFNSNNQPIAVHLAKAETDALGLGDFVGTLSAELMVFLAGISPFRLGGSTPEQWRLKAVSPEEWVFVLHPRENPDETEPEIEIHLNRRYQDAPARLEIRSANGETRVWRTLKYKLINGVWFPSEVEYTASSQHQKSRAQYTLLRTTRTRSLRIEIPEGITVYDYRKLGDDAWRYRDDYEETTWKRDLLGEKE